MKPNKALILLSAVAYVGCLLLTVFGSPPILNTPPIHQEIAYGFLAISLFITAGAYAPQDNIVKALLSLTYGMGAIFAFTGAVHWAGGDNAGFFMCLWDLALGTALLID